MQRVLIAIFLVNIVGVAMVYGAVGLIITIALTAGVYFGLKAKIGDKKNLAEKLSFGVVFVVAVFAVHHALQNAMITMSAALVEAIVFLIFMNAKDM